MPKLKQGQINDLNIPITPKDTEAILNSLSTKISPRPDGYRGEFYQTCKEDLIQILFKLFREIETEGTLPNSFYEGIVMLKPKPHKDQIMEENFRPISLMNIHAKILFFHLI